MSCESSADPKRARRAASPPSASPVNRGSYFRNQPSARTRAASPWACAPAARADHGPVRALVPDRGTGGGVWDGTGFGTGSGAGSVVVVDDDEIEKRFGAACRPVRSARARRVLLGEGGRGRHACGRGDRGEREERVATRASLASGRSRDFARAVVLGEGTPARATRAPILRCRWFSTRDDRARRSAFWPRRAAPSPPVAAVTALAAAHDVGIVFAATRCSQKPPLYSDMQSARAC